MRSTPYQQIIEWKKRRGDRHRLGSELIGQIDALQALTATVAMLAPAYVEFVPIRLVTILEVYLRGVIAEIVDEDDRFFERGERLVKGTKVDLAFAAHVNRHELTVGDFIAHAVSLNKIEAVVGVLDTLLDNFTMKLKSAHPRWSEEIAEWPLPPIVSDHDAMMATLARLYEARHLLTHELTSNPSLDTADVPKFFDAVRDFIEATDWVVIETLHDSVPFTQLRMNLNAGDNLRLQEELLARVVEEVAALKGINLQALNALQNAWSNFADMQAELAASQVEGGSMYSMVWSGEKAALVAERIEQLARLKQGWIDM